MTTLFSLIKRNMKLFFKDKGMFFSSLLVPLILLVLYATFLANVYKDGFTSSIPDGVSIDNKIINGLVSSQLFSSMLATCCITVAFSSNMIMVQDKYMGVCKDLYVTPVKKSILSLSYYISSLSVTLIINYIAFFASLIYVAFMGWFLSFADVLLIILDVIILSMFGTVLSSLINVFLSSQGQVSAISAIVSSCYGFLCGAYMPISNYGNGLQNVLCFLPSTYCTSLVKNHAMSGAFEEMIKDGIPIDIVEKIKTSVDCNISFFDNKVGVEIMYLIILLSIVLLLAIYVLISFLIIKGKIKISSKRRKKKH